MSKAANIIALILFVFLPKAISAQEPHQKSPSLPETLQWMQNSLAVGSGDVFIGGERRSIRLGSFSGCRVTFIYTTHKVGADKETFHLEQSFSLSDIDSEWVSFFASKLKDDAGSGYGQFTALTRNDAQVVAARSVLQNFDYTDSFVMFEFSTEYGPRFLKAFRHAVSICGGKPSIF
jgi:hypothetical protein